MDEYQVIPVANPPWKYKSLALGILGFSVVAIFFLAFNTFLGREKTQEIIVPQSVKAINSTRVAITSSGFEPARIEIKKGTVVEFINLDGGLHGIASDPFPTKDGLPSFDSIINIPERGVYTYQFDLAGTWGYFDPVHPFDFHGEIVVFE